MEGDRPKRAAAEEGFSLVELMVVVAIIGVLVSIASASYVVSIRSSRETACKANLKVIEGQVLAYRDRNGEYPPSLLSLVPEFVATQSGLRCPDSGAFYEYDPDTGTVSCPFHPKP